MKNAQLRAAKQFHTYKYHYKYAKQSMHFYLKEKRTLIVILNMKLLGIFIVAHISCFVKKNSAQVSRVLKLFTYYIYKLAGNSDNFNDLLTCGKFFDFFAFHSCFFGIFAGKTGRNYQLVADFAVNLKYDFY